MESLYNEIIDKLLDMRPDPIPHFVLLKEFKGYTSDCIEYQNAYKKVCEHSYVKKIAEGQNSKGFWPHFHAQSESMIRRLLWYGLDNSHVCLKKVNEYTIKLLHGKEPHDRSEKQDNIRWWPEIFMPLCCAATLSLLDSTHSDIQLHRVRWAAFAESAFSMGVYNREIDAKTQNDYFGFRTKQIIEPFNYYNLLLLSPRDDINCLTTDTDQALVDYCVNEAKFIGYVYNKNPGDLVSIDMQNRDSRDFVHWIRALSLISQFKGWAKYEQKYTDWIMGQRNQDGLWVFPKKYGQLGVSNLFGLSDSWRGNNKAIDSTIFVLRMLMRKQAL